MELVRRYFYQITEGCNSECHVKFCHSNPSFPDVPKDVALVLAHSIAGRVGKQYICPHLPKNIPEIPEMSTKLQLQDSTATKLDQILSNCLSTSLFELGFNLTVPPMRIATVLGKIKKHPSDHLLKAHYSEGLLEKIAQANAENTTSVYIPSPDSENESSDCSSSHSSKKSHSSTSNSLEANSSDYSFPSVSSISFHSHAAPQVHSLETLTSTENYGRRRSLSSGANHQVMAFRNVETVEEFIKKFTLEKPIKFNAEMLQKMLDLLGKEVLHSRKEPTGFRRLYARKQSAAKRSSSWDELSQVEEKPTKFNKSKIEPENAAEQRTLLTKTVHYLFADPLIMMYSFRKAPDSVNFNYAELLKCFQLLLKEPTTHNLLAKTLSDSLSFLLAQLKTRTYVRHPLSWMICYIVSIFPELKTDSELNFKLFKAYGNLSFEQRQTFLKCLLMNKPHLLRVIDATQYFIFKNYSISLDTQQVSDDDKYSNSSNESMGQVAEQKALLFIRDIYLLSRFKSEFKAEMFYNEALGNIVDFKKEFKLLKRGKSPILKHLYLFDCVAKTSLLQIQSLHIMSKEYEDACVNHAMVVHTSKILQESITTHELDKLLARVSNPYCLLELRREYILEDVMQYKEYIKKHHKKPLRVRFMDGEEGLDQGGVQKEFFLTFVHEVMNVDRGLFFYNERDRIAWIRGDSTDLELFELFGIVVGLASYNGVILDLHLPVAFFKKLANEQLGFTDFKQTFPDVATGLDSLRHFEGDVKEVFCLAFNLSYDTVSGTETFDLIPNGAEIPVTDENKEEYIELYINHKLNASIKKQFDQFSNGFWSTCGQILEDFTGVELEKILTGAIALDFQQLEKWTKYEGFSAEQPFIRYLNTNLENFGEFYTPSAMIKKRNY